MTARAPGRTHGSKSASPTGPYAGNVGIAHTMKGLALRVGAGGSAAERNVDLHDVGNASMIIEYMRWFLVDESHWVSVQVSGDGGDSWIELDKLQGPGTDYAIRTASYDISSYANSDTRREIRGVSEPRVVPSGPHRPRTHVRLARR